MEDSWITQEELEVIEIDLKSHSTESSLLLLKENVGAQLSVIKDKSNLMVWKGESRNNSNSITREQENQLHNKLREIDAQ